MSENITELDDKNFDKFIAEGKCIIDFWAPWCGPCQMMMPEFEAVAKKMKGKVKFGKVNVDDAPTIAMRLNIMSVPTIVLFKDGKAAGKNSGWLSSDGIENLIKESF
jgi:thioredoxin 1